MAKKNYYKERSRLKAAFLAFFGGFLGLHKFYLRETGGAMFYITLFIASINALGFPITTIFGIFDAMKLLMMPESEFDRKYNRHMLKQNRDYRRTPKSKVYRKKSRVKKNPFKKSGLKKYAEFALEEAIVDFTKGLEIDPNDDSLHFNIACTYSLTEQKDLAFKHLQKAVALGFKDLDKIATHDDLAFVRIQPAFDSFKASGYTNFKISRKTGTKSINQPAPKNDQLLAQLNKLKELREKGLINEVEYVAEQRRLMN